MVSNNNGKLICCKSAVDKYSCENISAERKSVVNHRDFVFSILTCISSYFFLLFFLFNLFNIIAHIQILSTE